MQVDLQFRMENIKTNQENGNICDDAEEYYAVFFFSVYFILDILARGDGFQTPLKNKIHVIMSPIP